MLAVLGQVIKLGAGSSSAHEANPINGHDVRWLSLANIRELSYSMACVMAARTFSSNQHVN